jgi:CRISPR/Cas system CSM-associated protein Csm3 (group 7 of RAMP superfamily)
MNTIIYKIQFHTFWHASSGLSGATYADLLVNKDENEFPYIPGKTLKGLLRGAAQSIFSLHPELVSKEFIEDVFGEKPRQKALDEETPTKEALSFFSNATLSSLLQESIGKPEKDLLYQVVTSTKIDKSGQADNGSLRQMEVTIPLTVYARIEQFPDKEGYEKELQTCMQFVKKMGLNRSRGLGRCQLTILKNN